MKKIDNFKSYGKIKRDYLSEFKICHEWIELGKKIIKIEKENKTEDYKQLIEKVKEQNTTTEKEQNTNDQESIELSTPFDPSETLKQIELLKSLDNKTLAIGSALVVLLLGGTLLYSARKDENKRINLLSKMVFIYSISIFEFFIKDLLTTTFNKKIDILKKDTEIKISKKELLELENTEGIKNYLINVELENAGYKSIKDLNNYLMKGFNIDLSEMATDWKKLQEFYYRRNLIVHNQGIINEIYCKATSTDKKKIGKTISLDEQYIEECITEFSTLVKKLTEEFSKKFKK